MFLALVTISDNTNSDDATKGLSFHKRRRWCAAKNLFWHSHTPFWTPQGSPPKEAAGHRAIHKKIQIMALW